jgi:citrate synthase
MGEEMEAKGKKIYPNVDFFSASVYTTLGIEMDLFTAVFAMARTPGWTAHLFEQYANNRLIRPEAEYVGPRDLKVKPIASGSDSGGPPPSGARRSARRASFDGSA